MDSELEQQKKTSDTQETECSEVCESLSELNNANIGEKHIDSVSCHPAGELIDSVLKDANSSQKSCDQMEHNPFHSAEMQMNTGSGNLTLHHSDLHSKRNVSSAEMQMDSGCGHDMLHYSDLYSHEAVPSAEITTKSGGGHIALHDTHLYSHKAVSPVEMQMNQGKTLKNQGKMLKLVVLVKRQCLLTNRWKQTTSATLCLK